VKYILVITILMVQLLDFQPANAARKEYKEIKIGDQVPNITLWGSEGRRYKIKKSRGSIIVLEWLDYTCGVIEENYKSGDIQNIQQVFVVRSDVFWASVHSVSEDDDRYIKKEEVLKRTMADKAYPDTVILDNRLRAAKVFGIKKVPAFVIIDANGKFVYKGKMKDDKHNYVTEAVEQLLSEEEVKISETKIDEGCPI